MGKSTKKKNTGGSYTINGNTISKTYYDRNGDLISDYVMNPYEESAYNYAQQAFADNIGKINTFSPETVSQMNKQIDAYKNQGIKEINDIYTPMISELQNNIANRFGNLDNSIFLDNLNNIESKKSDAISKLAQDITAKKNELISDELNKQYTYLDFLNNYQNQIYQKALNTITASQNNTKNNNYMDKSGSNNSLFNTAFNTAGSIFKTIF